MKNTLVPLDILFVKADGAIARIAPNTKPLSEEPIPSREPVRAVLEIPGGRAAQLGSRSATRCTIPSSRISHPASRAAQTSSCLV